MISAAEPNTRPKGHRVRKVIRIFFLTAIAVFAVLFSLQYAATLYEQERNPAPGMLVDVNGKKMHVYSTGQGEPTFVLLSGGGFGAPVLELNPLLSRFAKAARTVVAEYPGYGWSEDTDAPRTLEAIVEEIRAALKGAGIEPPYVLVGAFAGRPVRNGLQPNARGRAFRCNPAGFHPAARDCASQGEWADSAAGACRRWARYRCFARLACCGCSCGRIPCW